jgi:recombination associated protein RdgC
MWFKNIQIFRLMGEIVSAADLEAMLAKQAFAPCGSADMQSRGWLPPRDNGGLVHTVNRQMLLRFCTEKKLLPASVINQFTKIKLADIEEQQGYKPGKKQRKEIKEQVTDELMPRAFAVSGSTHVWIDPVHGWLVIDAASPAKADDVFTWLLRSIPSLPVAALRVVRAPSQAMTTWLELDEAPAGFTVDQDTELTSTGENKATVRYVQHTLEADDMHRHIKGGKRVTKLALTWNDRISFVLTDALVIKRVAALDVLKETGGETKDESERFDSDFALMAGELNGLLASLVAALGGEGAPEKGQLDIADISALEAANNLNKLLVADGATATLSVGGKVLAEFGAEDDLYDQAVSIVRAHQRASISLVQRHLRIGYNRAARLIEAMEVGGIVSAMQSNGNRDVLAAA